MPADSKETNKLREKARDLRNALTPHVRDVAYDMNAADGLLSDDDLAVVQNVQAGLEGSMADKIIAALKLEVKADPENYYTFLKILRDLGKKGFKKIISELEFEAEPEPPKPEPKRSSQPTDKLELVDNTPFAAINEDKADIMDVLTDFNMSKWSTLTTNLRLRDASMQTIETNHSKDASKCLQLALVDWLKLNYDYERNGRPSWRKLAKAVKPIDATIFEKIVAEYPVQPSSRVTPPPQSPPPPVYPVLEKRIDMGKMDLLKWDDPESGKTQRLNLIREMSPEWRRFGSLIGLSEAQLKGWDMQHCKDPEACMKSVVGTWMERKNKQYQPTWKGLLVLLVDADLDALKEEILRAAASKSGKLYD